MAIRDRVRRVLGVGSTSTDSSLYSTRSSNFTTSSNSVSSRPRSPSIKLTETLTRTLTFRSTKSQKTKEEKALEKWAKRDAKEWKKPSVKYPFKKSQQHQDILRAFQWNVTGTGDNGKEKGEGERNSVWSGISPFASRRPSFVDETMQKCLSRGSHQGLGDGLRKASITTLLIEDVERAEGACAV